MLPHNMSESTGRTGGTIQFFGSASNHDCRFLSLKVNILIFADALVSIVAYPSKSYLASADRHPAARFGLIKLTGFCRRVEIVQL